MTTLVWLRRDLRLRDNPALHAAFNLGEPVVPVYIYSPDEEKPWAPGAASRWYLHHTLTALSKSMKGSGLELLTASGSSADQLIALTERVDAKRVFWNRIYEPGIIERDSMVAEVLQAQGLQVELFHDHSLYPPGHITKKSGDLYRVFTPFWRCLANPLNEASGEGLYSEPVVGHEPKATTPSEIDALGLLDEHPWHEKLLAYWQAGETAAKAHLSGFLEKLNGYKKGRDFPAQDATSRLSVALHFGELSPWRIVDALRPAYQGEHGKQAALNADAFLRQLGWREFAINLLHMAPNSPDYSLQKKFEDSGVWFHDQKHIDQWQQGNTGFPLVDAGMAELWETGWMHNRVRMVVASMLTKNLGQHWIHGARWFWDTLVDADLANNTMGWQWVAGCGCDAAPYYRIFNPETQAKRFDPDGQYISQWLDSAQLSAPIVDLASSREDALTRYAQIPK